MIKKGRRDNTATARAGRKFKGRILSVVICIVFWFIVSYSKGFRYMPFEEHIGWSFLMGLFTSPVLMLIINPILQWRTNKKEEAEEIRKEQERKREEREREEREMMLRIREKEELTRIDTDAILTIAREKDKLDREKLILIQTLENQLATARQQDIADIEAQIRRLKNGL